MPEPAAPVAGAFWRRALQALAHAFDASREADGGDTVFQTGDAQARICAGAEEDPQRPCADRRKETLQ